MNTRTLGGAVAVAIALGSLLWWLSTRDRQSSGPEPGSDPLSTRILAERDPHLAVDAVWEIAASDRNDRREALLAPLEGGLAGQTLSREQEEILFQVLLALGYVADDEPEATAALVKRLEPEFWSNGGRNWSSPRGDLAAEFLVAGAIQAIGWTPAKVHEEVLDGLQEHEARYLHRFGGDILQARYYAWLRQKFGDGFLSWVRNRPEEFEQEFDRWTETDEGRAGLDWANASMRGPRPESGR